MHHVAYSVGIQLTAEHAVDQRVPLFDGTKLGNQ
jgi:hypothetical protein